MLHQGSPQHAYAVQPVMRQSIENGKAMNGKAIVTPPSLKQSGPKATPPDVSGVGIFFQVPENDQGVAYVQHIVPRSSAERCGTIQLGDELLAAGEVGQNPTIIEGPDCLRTTSTNA